MPIEEWPLNTLHFRYKGIMDFEGVYNMIYAWFLDRKYRTQETKYKNKPDSPWGYEHEVKIDATKKADAFYQYKVKVLLHGRDMAEIEHKGKKLMNGRFHLMINATLVMDYSDKFSKNNFTKLLGKLYLKMIKREAEFKHWDPLYYRLHYLQNDVKKFLNSYTEETYFK